MKISKVKLLSIAVIALLLINVSTLASIWPYVNLKDFTFTPPAPQNTMAFLTNKLNLDKEQQAELDVLRKEHFEEMASLRNKIYTDKQSIYALLNTNSTDKETVYEQMAQTMRDEERLNHLTVDHFRKIRAICTDEQKQHFDAIIDRVMKMSQPQPAQLHLPASSTIQTPLP